MSVILKISVVAVCTAIMAVVVRKNNRELGLMVSIAGCCVAGLVIVGLFRPVVDFVNDVADSANISQRLLTPVLKTVGIGLLTQFGGAVCTDAGETALAKMAELGGCVLCICVSLPLFSEVLELIRAMTGG